MVANPRRGPGSTYVLTGLEHSLPLAAEELEFADDEIAPALSFEGATMATHLTLVKPGDVVIGVSATPCSRIRII